MGKYNGRDLHKGGAMSNAHILTDNNQSKVKPRPPLALQALGNFVIMWYDEEKKVKMTRAGLILPEGTQDNYETPVFEVLSVGPECKSGVKVGDVVTCWVEVRIQKYMFNGGKWVYISVTEDKITGKIDTSNADWQSVYGQFDTPIGVVKL